MLAEVSFNNSIELPRVKKNTNNEKNHRVKKNNAREKKHVYSFEEIQKNITESLVRTGGRYVRFDNPEHSEGLMCAGVSIDNAIFFAIINKDRKIEYVPSNIHYTVLRYPSNNLSVLDYLYKTNHTMIENIVTVAFENEDVEPFTKNYIIRERVKNNNRRKNNSRDNKNKE